MKGRNECNKKNIINLGFQLKENVDLILLVYGAVLGMIIPIFNIEILGVTMTVYRCLVPIMTFYYLYRRFWVKKSREKYDKLVIYFISFIFFWGAYGILGLWLSPYSDFVRGAKEILNIFLAGMSVYCFVEACTNRDKVLYVFRLIKALIVILCIIAMFEIITDNHLSLSRYEDGDLKKLLGSSRGIYFATTIFFNPNDFSAFLSIFTPLFFISKDKSKVRNIIDSMVLVMILYILYANDATITIIAVCFGIIVCLVIGRIGKFNSLVQLSIILTSFSWIPSGISRGIVTLKSFFYNRRVQDTNISEYIPEIVVPEIAPPEISTAVGEQIANASEGYGSLYMRVQVTWDSIIMTLDSNLLGVGPGGFSNYMNQNEVRSTLENPHNWWLEILSQYGIVIFLIFIGLFMMIVGRLIKNYCNLKSNVCLSLIGCFVVYILSAVAPSTFLGYSYQWMIFGVGLAILNNSNNENAVK